MPLKTLKIRGLGTKGVISDLSPYDTDVSSWTDSRNIRFTQGRAIKVGGYLPLFYNNREDALVYKDKKQKPMHLSLAPQSFDSWFYCTENAIWRTDGWTHTNMSPVGAPKDPENPDAGYEDYPLHVNLAAPWSSTTISNATILASTLLRVPLGMSEKETRFRPLSNWGPGTEWNCTTIRTFKNFVMAIGGGDEYPQRIRWSNLVPPRALPADWGWQYEYSAKDEEANPADKEGTLIPTSDKRYGQFIDGSAGGYNDLSFALGNVVDGRPLRDQFMIYTDSEVIACDYVGGNDIFRFRALFDDGGAFNPDCVAVFENKHFVVSGHDVYIHNGSTKQSVIDNKIRERLLQEITSNSPSSVKVVPYLPQNEIWVLYAGPDAVGLNEAFDETEKEATRAAIYNYRTDVWSFIDIPRTLDIKLGPAPMYNDVDQKVDTWDKVEESFEWEDSLELWNLAGGGDVHNLREYSLVCASADGGFYVLDRTDHHYKLGVKNSDTGKYPLIRSDIVANLGKNYIDLDELTETIDYKTLLSIWPQVLGQGELYIQVGGAHVPGGPITWGPAVRFLCSENRKVDLRQNYRYLCINIQGRGAGTWSFSGFDAVVRVGGRM